MTGRDRGYRAKSEPTTRGRGQVVRRPDDPDDGLARPPRARATPKAPEPHPDEGTFSGLIAPHPGSTPLERAAQIVLTCVALPLVVVTFVTFGLFDLRAAMRDFQQGAPVRRQGGIAHPVTWFVGTIVLTFALGAARVPAGGALLLTVPQLGALLLRRWLRNGIDARAPQRQP